MRLLTFTMTATIGIGMVGNVSQVIAGSESANLTVTASVNAKCKLSNASPVAFGPYDPVDVNASAPLDATGSFTVKCTKGSTGILKINAGQNTANAASTGAGTTRALKATGSATYLGYELYSDTNHSSVWNDSSGTVTYGPAASANDVTKTVYGRIPGGQTSVAADSYSDTVVVTVTY